MVPVAPKSNKLVSDGDKKVSGFNDKPAARGLNKIEMMYITTLTAMRNLTNRFESRNPRVQALFFHQEPGLAVSQYGHRDSELLMSFLQLGQRMDCR